jgi:hypothetical protein
MGSDLLDRMRRNPAADWRIEDWKGCAANMACCFARAKEHPIVTPNTLTLAKY